MGNEVSSKFAKFYRVVCSIRKYSTHALESKTFHQAKASKTDFDLTLLALKLTAVHVKLTRVIKDP